MNGRLDLMEDRLDFTERLLSSGERRGRAGDRLTLTDEERPKTSELPKVYFSFLRKSFLSQ
jgi:hypothetical protein